MNEKIDNGSHIVTFTHVEKSWSLMEKVKELQAYRESYYTCKRLQPRMMIGTSPKDLKYNCKLSIASPCGTIADFAKSEEET